ncbi:MAG: ParA family protein [Campylobacterota bacterium]
MIISIFNKKGGVGKTSLSFSLARDLKYFLISNDDSVIELCYEGKAKIMQEPKIIDNCIYDFGGFVTPHISHILEISNYIIVPLTSDLNSLKKTVQTVKEINSTNIVFVANKSEKEDFKEIENYLESHFKFPIFEVKNSRIWAKTFKEKKSVSEIKNESKINSYVYKNSISGYEDLLKYLKK